MTSRFTERFARLSPAQRQQLQRLLQQRQDDAGETDGRRDQPRTATERALARIWEDSLAVCRPGIHDDFYELGGDSIIGMQVAARATAEGIALSPQQVLQAPTIAQLAEVGADVQAQERDEPLGDVPLTPIQRWFFEQDLPEGHHWDQTLHLRLRRPVDAGVLRRALSAVVSHHDVLRSRFVRHESRWRQHVHVHAPEPALSVVELAPGDEALRKKQQDRAVEAAQGRLSLDDGQLVAAVVFRERNAADELEQLVLVIHHLVVDGISLRLLVEDLDRAYRRLDNGHEPDLPPKTMSFRQWAQLLCRWACEPEITDQLRFWRSVPDSSASSLDGVFAAPVPQDRERRNTVGRSGTVRTRIGQDVAESLLRDAPGRGEAPLHLLLAALSRAWPRTAGRTELQLDLEAHGREVVEGTANVARTVGWFTSIFPVRLPLGSDHAHATVAEVAEVLNAVPHNGIGYGLLRYLGGDTGLADLPQSQVSFNYLGRFESGGDAVLGSPVQSPGVLHSPEAPRRYLLEVVVTAVERELVVEMTFARDHLAAADVQALAGRFERYLTELVRRRETADSRPGGMTDDQLAVVRRQLGIQ